MYHMNRAAHAVVGRPVCASKFPGFNATAPTPHRTDDAKRGRGVHGVHSFSCSSVLPILQAHISTALIGSHSFGEHVVAPQHTTMVTA